MSRKSRADLINDVNTILADNTSNAISLEDFRNRFIDLIDSALNLTTDTGVPGLYAWNGSTQYYTNQIVNKDGNWYKANTDPALDGIFHDADWDALANNLYKATLSLTAAEVKALFTTPKTIVAAVSGKTIELVSSFMTLTYGTLAFATDTSPYLYIDTATKKLADFPTALAATVSRKVKGIPLDYAGALAATDTQMIENKALKITCAADPTDGDSTVVITVFYLLV